METKRTKDLPKDVVNTLIQALTESPGHAPFMLVKSWVEQYDSESKFDKVIAIVATDLIGRISKSIVKDLEDRGGIDSVRAFRLVVCELRVMAEGYERMLSGDDGLEDFSLLENSLNVACKYCDEIKD